MSGIHLMSVEGAESSCTTAYYDERTLIYLPRRIILLSTTTLRFVSTQCRLIPD
jgi:hypothetical protein